MNKQNKPNRFTEFFAGKGFYVVLFICIAAVGISGYVLFFGLGSKAEEKPQDISLNWVEPEATANPARVVTPAPLPSTTPSAARTMPPAVSTAPSVNMGGETQLNPNEGGLAEAAAPTELPASPAPPKVVQTPVTPSQKPDKTNVSTFYWPVSGSVVIPHSLDELLFNPTMGDWRTHAGVDIESVDGAAVCAAADGKVLQIEDDPIWGTTVVLEHTGGLTSTYSNLLSGASVTIGQSVKAGDIIGGVGNSAMTELDQTPHLHFEMKRDGQQVDPQSLLPKKAN